MQKTPADSYTEQVQILTQSAMNGNNRLFGGRLMEWIDIVAAVVARRHSCSNVVTAAVERLDFEGIAKINSLIVLSGKMVYAGRSSMQVMVKSYVEELSGERKLINRAYLTMVAVDEENRPREVPGLLVQTEEEIAEYRAAEQRIKEYKQRTRLEKDGGA